MSRSGVDEREVQYVWIRLCCGAPCYRSDNTGRGLRPPRCGNARAPYPSLSTADTRLTCSGRTTPSHLQAEATVVGSGRRFALLTHESRRSCHEDSHLFSAFTSSARIVGFLSLPEFESPTQVPAERPRFLSRGRTSTLGRGSLARMRQFCPHGVALLHDQLAERLG
jgi:hypothetical protein